MNSYIYYRKDLNKLPYLILVNHEYNWKYNNKDIITHEKNNIFF